MAGIFTRARNAVRGVSAALIAIIALQTATIVGLIMQTNHLSGLIADVGDGSYATLDDVLSEAQEASNNAAEAADEARNAAGEVNRMQLFRSNCN